MTAPGTVSYLAQVSKRMKMKRTSLLTLGVMALAVSLPAQNDADYPTWMKTVATTAKSLRGNLESKNSDGAATDAKKLQEVFGQVKAYWQKKDVADATKFASDAADGFGDLATQSAASKFDDASATLKKTSANCAGCHAAHREKAADGSFTIK